jgi:hypothetical protein
MINFGSSMSGLLNILGPTLWIINLGITVFLFYLLKENIKNKGEKAMGWFLIMVGIILYIIIFIISLLMHIFPFLGYLGFIIYLIFGPALNLGIFLILYNYFMKKG